MSCRVLAFGNATVTHACSRLLPHAFCRFGGAGGITGYFGNDTTTVGPITATNFEFLVADGDSGTGGKGSGLYGFALGSYALPCGEASDQVSTWKQLSTAAGVAGTELDRVGLWLSNDQQFLQAATSFGGEPPASECVC